MSRVPSFLLLLGIPAVALAADVAPADGCDDARAAANGACVHPTVLVGDAVIGAGAFVGPYTAFDGLVYVAPKAHLAGSSDTTVRTFAGPTTIGRRTWIGQDAELGAYNTWARAVVAGDRLWSGGNVAVGYGAILGDDVTLYGGSFVANLAELGDHVTLGVGARVGRGALLASGTAERPTTVDGTVAPDAEIGSGAEVGANAHVARGATVGALATVEEGGRVGRDAIVHDGATVGTGATVRAGAVVLPNTEVPDFTYVRRGETWSQCGTTPGVPTVLSAPTVIGAADLSYECADLVVSSTLSVSGAHTFRSLTVAPGGVVSHPARELTGLSLTLNGPLVVQGGGRIDVTGLGGAGGLSSGENQYRGERWTPTGFVKDAGSSEHRAGGSYGARGQNMTRNSNAVYDNPRSPVGMGSGGGANSGAGGAGGGRVDIVATDLVVDGQILANGVSCGVNCGSGSGGAIRLYVTGDFSGAGTIAAVGGGGNATNKGYGGGGRVAITGYQGFSYTGAAAGGTVFVRSGDRAHGLFRVDGVEAALTIQGDESPTEVVIANGGAITSYVPLSLPALDLQGSLIMHAPLTVAGAFTANTGASTFHAPVSVGSWTHLGGTATFGSTVSAPSWTQSGGTATLNGAATIGAWSQTGGTASLGAAGSLSPSSFSLSGGSFSNAGSAAIPAFSAAAISGGSFTNTGALTLGSAELTVAAGVSLTQDGALSAVGRPAETLDALTVAGTLRRTVQTMEGLHLDVLGPITVPTGGLIDVSGAGGRGAVGGTGVGTPGHYGERWTPTGPTVSGGSENRAGGSYGSKGEFRTRAPGPTYGDPRDPVEYGSGGGTSYSVGYTQGGHGGGRLDLSATDLALDGELRANGNGCNAHCGAGSGGAIRVVLSGAFSGGGAINAVGGPGNPSVDKGYGGGGRVAVRGFSSTAFTGTAAGGTVFLLAADGTQGTFLVDGAEAALDIGATEVPVALSIANGGRLVSHRALSLPSLQLDGDLVMNAPLTVAGTVTATRGASVFHDAVDVGAWTHTGGTATFHDALVAPSWTQSGGTATFNGPVSTASWAQTGGAANVGASGTFAPTAISIANSSFTNAGATTLPALTAVIASGSTTLTNTGTLTLLDDSAVEIAPGVTVVQDGALVASGRPANTLAALRVAGTLRRTVQTMEGLHLEVLGLLDVPAGGLIDVSGAGGRGGRGKAISDPDSFYYGERWTSTGPTVSGGAYNRSGGSYGSLGEDRNGAPNAVYGDATDPVEYGSGGGATSQYSPGGHGGGRLDLFATDAILDGTLRADGTGCSAHCGAGSGGAIRLTLTGALSGSGLLSAAGGPGNPSVDKGYGGGGRVAIVGNSAGAFTGTATAGSAYVNGVVTP